ncbi:MAG: PhoH family protein [Gammaproteobacteria bacterium]|nr:MAG: PhoH family protein [Gammaproteobacteria bacterium]
MPVVPPDRDILEDRDQASLDLQLDPPDNERLANLCGQFDENLRHLEERLAVRIGNRGNHFHISGPATGVEGAAAIINSLYELAAEEFISPDRVHIAVQESGMEPVVENDDAASISYVDTPRRRVHPRGRNQSEYLRRIRELDLNFGVGPAGTGKTYLAVGAAVEALETEHVRRIVLVRPAVEAGERLGFLPGDMAQKVDPYLRPMYDALYEMLGFEKVGRLIERSIIEVAPLAFMRGRTLNQAFVILDEAQNTTSEQMKMFLTRIGFGSRAVVTGDVTQTDLPENRRSGLSHAADILRQVPGVGFTFFTSRDVVRHPLVQRIVEAYDETGSPGDEGGGS